MHGGPQDSSYLRRLVGDKGTASEVGHHAAGVDLNRLQAPLTRFPSAPPQPTEKLEPIPDHLKIPPLKFVWRDAVVSGA